MNLLLLNVLLAIAWSALTGSFQPLDLLFGFGLGYLVLWITTRMGVQTRYFKQVPLVLGLLGRFLVDLLTANFRMAATILSPRMDLRPAVVAVPLILDISTDRRTLFIHTVYLDDPEQFKQQLIEGYEKRLKELFDS